MDVVDDQENLRRAQSAFERGDYKSVQELIVKIGQSSDKDSQIAAAELAEQLKPSQLSRYLLGLTFVILLVVTAFAYAQ